MAADGAIMILDEAVRPFERIWCLFEVKRLTELQKESSPRKTHFFISKPGFEEQSKC